MTEGQLQSAQYLHRELPVRLAHAVTALDKVGWRVTCSAVRCFFVVARLCTRTCRAEEQRRSLSRQLFKTPAGDVN